jgi:hypothetical protein
MQLSKEELDQIVELVCSRMAQGALEPKPLGVVELAEYLGVEPSWVYGQTKNLPHFKAGKHTRFMLSEVLPFLRRRNKFREACNASDRTTTS